MMLAFPQLYVNKLPSYPLWTMNNQFNNRSYNISIVQNISYLQPV